MQKMEKKKEDPKAVEVEAKNLMEDFRRRREILPKFRVAQEVLWSFVDFGGRGLGQGMPLKDVLGYLDVLLTPEGSAYPTPQGVDEAGVRTTREALLEILDRIASGLTASSSLGAAFKYMEDEEKELADLPE